MILRVPRVLTRVMIVGCGLLGTSCDSKRPSPDASVNASHSPPTPLILDSGTSESADAHADRMTTPESAAPQSAARADSSWPATCADLTAAPAKGKSVGHTSVVFKLELANSRKIAFKPNARRVKGRYRGEIAAVRLADALGLSAQLLPACPCTFDRRTFMASLTPDAAKLAEAELLPPNASDVHGAAIMWLDGLQFWPLEKEPLRSLVRSWLTRGQSIPDGKSDFARQASQLIVFDYVTGNWDRYSGENVGLDKAGRTVLFIDNDAAFMESPPSDSVVQNRARVQGTDRFSKSLVTALRSIGSEAHLESVLGQDGSLGPLLPRPIIDAVMRRIEETLKIIDTKIAAAGSADTLFFP